MMWPLLLSRYLVLVENKGSRAVEEKGGRNHLLMLVREMGSQEVTLKQEAERWVPKRSR